MTATHTEPLWSTPIQHIWRERAQNHDLPLWLRVACYAEAGAVHGHRALTPEQLHQALDPTMDKAMISRAIRTAVDYGWLHPASSARCLVLARASGLDPECPATHRPPS